jgi:3-hydroxyisobutyrate dehydrogenase-like beta-hydroxyacid dehydrogenase
MKVALLGTGKMGTAIARKLDAAGFDVTLWNRRLDRARAVGVGTVAPTAAAAAERAEVVLSILFDAQAVREVYGTLEPAAGQVFVEMSTAGPDVLEEIAPRLTEAGAELLASPIIGSMPAIQEASALLLVGGELSAFERVRPVLSAFGQPEHVGSRRHAAVLKLLNNAMLGACSLAAAELVAASRRMGADPARSFAILSRTMPYLRLRQRGYLERAHEALFFELDAMVKDLSLAVDVAQRSGAAIPVTSLSRELYAMAAPEHGREEITAVIEEYP